MRVLEKLLSEDSAKHDVESNNIVEDSIIAETSIPEETKRVVRQVRQHRPGFFYTLARLAFEVRATVHNHDIKIDCLSQIYNIM